MTLSDNLMLTFRIMMTDSDKQVLAADERHAIMNCMMTDNARTMKARRFLTRP